jgi:signal transduction histidine kinase
LDERSNRLKQLVEDLVDASKAITGNIKADLIPIELKQLVMQCAGEYMDRMEANHLTIIMDKVNEVQVLADSSHMQRILDNLLSNVNKYAMPGTRVYLEVMGNDMTGQIVIKNISKEYLSIHPDELAERFVRGDKMRTTEGSGLGLAIVKSLVELQKGLFKSSIDGDLFKVEISLPLYN